MVRQKLLKICKSSLSILKDKKNISKLKRKLIKPKLQEKKSTSNVVLPNYKLRVYNIFYSQ